MRLKCVFTLYPQQAMKWSEGHDIFFLKEVLQFKPWQHKKGTTERGEVWGHLALLLGSNTDPLFHVTQRSVRDRYMLLEKRYRKKVADDKKASGTSPNQSEVDILLEEIVALFDEADQLHESNKRKIQEEASQAEEMRNASLETFKQTKDRQDETPKAKKKEQVELTQWHLSKKGQRWNLNKERVTWS